MHIKIHNSDIQFFKRCRRRWDYSSDLRRGFKPTEVVRPLDFGSAVHAGLQVYYDPATWDLCLDGTTRPMIIANAIRAALDHIHATRARYVKLSGRELTEDELEEYREDLDLAEGMLRHYFGYVHERGLDARFRPVAVEMGFELPILERELEYLRMFHPELARITFNGKIDLVVQDVHDGTYWTIDHKTAKTIRDKTNFLELDEQLPSYNAALWARGFEVAGSMYSELMKAYPKPPDRLLRPYKGRNFSTNKQQPTDYETTRAALVAAGEPLELYEDYLQYLRVEGVPFVQRTIISNSATEYRLLLQRIEAEAMDMLTEPRIYPSPALFGCDGCPFRPACVAENQGQDVDWVLNQHYKKEPRTNG